MLDMAKSMIGWEDWQGKLEAMRAQGRMVGMGIGTTLDSGTNNFGQSRIINPNSPFTGNSEVANVRVGVDGRITVAVGSVPQGQGHETVAAQVVAEALGISPDWVLVQPGFDTDRNTHTSHSGTYASQFAVTSLGAIHGAVQALKAELRRLAAHDLGLPPDELIFTEHQGVPAVLSADRQRGRSLAELAARVNTQTAGLPAELADLTLNVRHVYRAPFELPDTSRKYGNLTLTYAAQVHIAVVEIDPDTHNLQVLDYAVVDDCGRVINHAIVTGQVHGAAAHGLGAVLMEHLRYDEYGNLATSTFSDYCPITMLNMPTLKYRNYESPSPFTFNGAKGMGEGGGGPLHAMSAAVQDAVWSRGAVVAHSHLPPSDLYDLVRGTGRLSRVRSERRHG
jgi:2-furoyl-CoA dehydrogenase large subunit